MAITPGGRVGDASPLGKGKRKLSDYERELAHALMRKGHPKRRAIMMARGIIRNAATLGKWGPGKVRNPAVRAGAAASIAQRKAFVAAHNLSDPVLAVALAEARNRDIDLAVLTTKRRRAKAKRKMQNHAAKANKRATQAGYKKPFPGAAAPFTKKDLTELTTKRRKALPTSSFAIPSKKAYPIHDRAHAANALARVAQHGTPAEMAQVHAAVARKYPDMPSVKKTKKPKTKLNGRKPKFGSAEWNAMYGTNK